MSFAHFLLSLTIVHLREKNSVLDFSVLDAELWPSGSPTAPSSLSLRLELSGALLDRSTMSRQAEGSAGGSPIFAIANYVLDSLRHDAFRVVDGKVGPWYFVLC